MVTYYLMNSTFLKIQIAEVQVQFWNGVIQAHANWLISLGRTEY